MESQESLLRRFQRMVQTSGILREVKAGRHLSAKSGATRIKAHKKRPAEAVTGYLEEINKIRDKGGKLRKSMWAIYPSMLPRMN